MEIPAPATMTPAMEPTGSRPPIHVTRTFLPPQEEYLHWLRKAYASHHLTNQGPIHQELEETLRVRSDVPYLRLMANGTLALQLAIRALGVQGKVITTPFSYVATTSAILWEGCEPVFADIDPGTCCIDPAAIEAAITPGVTAILATHVYGIPCDVEAIDAIAKRHGLKVIYDAAHAFDVTYKGQSILQWGDASTLSFHATKLFHTVEGGAVVLHDAAADERLRLLRSFGHRNDDHISLGMNAKMSELHAAMGMAVLPHVERIIEQRARICDAYDQALADVVVKPGLPAGVSYNYAYHPVQFRDEAEREHVLAALASQGIHCRRYFYPSLDELPYVVGRTCPHSRDAALRTLCLPLYPELAPRDTDRITGALLAALDRRS
ncbi:MAG TPA: DegT/DnrJ/EryC1/StrS family aminotransferase [Flavobacteriales bacterium]|nr:DegT/DnrJ/EryC1/StrS family aminotransferase [Flavobacteriales bacterium]HNE80941.1 DegT/DnrJ/EryC1/StrS family aminotransferase [Flavobacteriales bacterium]HNI05488.1 DegT/DnrJ/EryC1/StrS family aminotransferase [Flavobacteriales bacterium]HNK70404.1 DegT/DnrJ/EryC1/StrS family aminotransferase [Flavobacteriales bacterium]HNK86021.1 DegT/DnrJ/EryC1/StrS family aminotransferase [Flavobacteriales bacterium]